ncbi:hypothetical protein GQ600_16678 [Phytophthora cactorum]|nr:hypothetical protein GQ600_16678 [Phytophthora cactorum]
MTARRHQVLNGTTKYKHALERGKSIVDIMSRNGTHVFREMMTALQKFEEKLGIDPLFQLSSLPFTSDNTDTAGADAADVVTGVSPTSKPPTQRSAIPMEPKVPQVTKPVVLDTSGVPQGTEATTRTEYVPNKANLVKENFVKESQAPPSAKIPAKETRKRREEAASRARETNRYKARARTLTPIPSVRNIVKLLDNDYSYEEMHRLLPTLTPKDKESNHRYLHGR